MPFPKSLKVHLHPRRARPPNFNLRLSVLIQGCHTYGSRPTSVAHVPPLVQTSHLPSLHNLIHRFVGVLGLDHRVVPGHLFPKFGEHPHLRSRRLAASHKRVPSSLGGQ
ncbi:hypothetical protein GALMADRAFT_401896 [Galerina marginata CBS 339.88]|uniref:Uncharacterized protein n=1 Tax=Galerina marginata (strain CBS 339.88) TaxID=685588 RepID=A0A067TSD4_GALM3|nr:hypothetical protein GALMADRAFT_401896 [Galerina marginata CBS 339.88]